MNTGAALTMAEKMDSRPTLTLNWRGRTAPVPELVEIVPQAEARPTEQSRPQGGEISPWSEPGPLDTCLACWKAWMHGDADRDLGYKPMGGLLGDHDGRGVDPHEAQQAADTRIAIATDAMIESLSRIHIWAIYRMSSLATPWRFPNADLLQVGDEARTMLTEKLKKNVCTAVFF